MEHLLIRVTDVNVVETYTLQITFADDCVVTINFEPVLHGYYYGPLRDPKLFNQVKVDPEIGTLVWPNGADFDPATLYNWHRGEGEELARKVKEWPSLEQPSL